MPSEELMEAGYDTDHQCGPFVQNGVEDEEFYNMDEAAPEAPIEAVPVLEEGGDGDVAVAEIVLDEEAVGKLKVAELRDALQKRGLPITGLKAVLQTRLLEAVANNVPVVGDRPVEEVENQACDSFQPGAYWKLLEPQGAEVDESNATIDGVRFRGPTMPAAEHEINSEHRPKKRNYGEVFDRAPFTSSVLLPVRKQNGTLQRKSTGAYVYSLQSSVETVPDLKYLSEKGIDLKSHPADWFNLFFPRNRDKNTHPKTVTIDELTSWTNTKAMIANAGKRGGKYNRFVDFSKAELMQHLSLYLLHGISPSPQIEMKFTDHTIDPVNGSSLCNRIFGKRGVTRHKEFKAFLGAVNPIVPTPPTTTHPNWKIDPVLKSMMRVSQEAVCIGQDVSVDEQDIGFQGRHKDKQRVNFKKVGDGFLVDCLCAEGYTYAWYFRNQVAPKSWTDKDLSPLHARVMSLFQQLPLKHYICGMDNLYMSAKFAKVAMIDSEKNVLIHGVTRASRGIPPCITQEAVTKKEDLLRTRGTMKAAVLTGDSDCPGLVATSLYDSKPVYLLSNACTSVQWTEKKRKLWHKANGKYAMVPFYRLNIIDQYNHGMGNVDQADQLRLQYCSTYWLRNRKWWWLIFFWLFEGGLCNSYVLYRMFFKLHDLKPPWTHYEYIRAISLAWLDQETYWPSRKKTSASSNITQSSQSSTSSMMSRLRPSNTTVVARSVTFTDKTLDAYSGALRCRLDRHFAHLPERGDKKVNSCQLCYWKNKERVRSQVLRCNTCQILLCIDCFKPFHEVADLNMLKP